MHAALVSAEEQGIIASGGIQNDVRARLNGRRNLPRGRESGKGNGMYIHKEAWENVEFSRNCERGYLGPEEW